MDLLDRGEIGKREERVGIRAQDGPDEAALHEVPQMVLAQLAVTRQKIPHRVVLSLERVGRRHANQPAEFFLADDLNPRSFLRVQILRALQIVAGFLHLGFVRGGFRFGLLRRGLGGLHLRLQKLKAGFDELHVRFLHFVEGGFDGIGAGSPRRVGRSQRTGERFAFRL